MTRNKENEKVWHWQNQEEARRNWVDDYGSHITQVPARAICGTLDEIRRKSLKEWGVVKSRTELLALQAKGSTVCVVCEARAYMEQSKADKRAARKRGDLTVDDARKAFLGRAIEMARELRREGKASHGYGERFLRAFDRYRIAQGLCQTCDDPEGSHTAQGCIGNRNLCQCKGFVKPRLREHEASPMVLVWQYAERESILVEALRHVVSLTSSITELTLEKRNRAHETAKQALIDTRTLGDRTEWEWEKER